jgi:hypothetical protein
MILVLNQSPDRMREVRRLKIDDTPGCWTVYAACVSDEVQDLLESNWRGSNGVAT